MKKYLCLNFVFACLLLSTGCPGDSTSCNSHTTVSAQNGQIYIIYDAQGNQQPGTQTGANGQVNVPCGGSAVAAQ